MIRKRADREKEMREKEKESDAVTRCSERLKFLLLLELFLAFNYGSAKRRKSKWVHG
jgi:hypothetical protein